jgi:D-beta-D-heptose 7-phosphate kinase/D-beta-D-heptose 1-phosphate adenosyltransferase
MLDEYLWGEISRISPEAPVPVMRLVRSEHSLGGAANVARNTASLGARVSALGVIGADSSGKALLAEFDRLVIDREGVLIDSARPTTRKTRLMSIEHRQQVFRLDEESTSAISASTEDQILRILSQRICSAHAVICSDYLKGTLTNRILGEVAELAHRFNVPLVTAPKDLHADKYSSACVLMPNYREFARLVGQRRNGDSSDWMERGARMLLERNHFKALLVTRGSAGMTLFEKPNGTLLRQDIPAVGQSVYDVTGAGDTAISVFALALAAGASRTQAACVANIAAGIVVGKRGTAWVTREELLVRAQEGLGLPVSVPVAAGQI